tara:strand:+ start:10091 stop:10813 length:723 start_codon:yes stop_codon:yes gene_type:complete
MKDIKGIILAGGTGSRLYPLTKVTNKHLLPIGGKPMIDHTILRLVEAGITDIMIITGIEHCGAMMSLLGSGASYDCSFTYRVQDEPNGIGGALSLCRDFVGDSDCVVLLGDNIFQENLEPYVREFQSIEKNCMLFFKRVADPRRYGVGVFARKKLIKVEEKPDRPQTDLACVGIYFYSNKVFDILGNMKKSDRGEYEISDINNEFIESGDCTHAVLEGRWSDAGTMSSYHSTNWAIYQEI